MSRILVVEDNPAIRDLLVTLLSCEGYHVEAAADGDAAVTIVDTRPVDLVLCDVVLPGRNGFDVCQHIKSSAATRLIPVVLVTGLAEVENRVRGIEAGADDFLTKPFEQVELLARVRSLLRVKSYTDALESAEIVLRALARTTEARDPYTQGHCTRLGVFGTALARAFGMSEDQVHAVELAGTVHDIGKIAIPDSILLKPGPLTPEERTTMERHPLVGEELCQPIRSFRQALPIIRHHHERLDGTGYPDGIGNGELPMTARVLQVVDVFDAITTDRPYKRAQPMHVAIAELRAEAARGWWDVDVVETFAGLLVSRPELSRLVGAADPVLIPPPATPLSVGPPAP